jgi:tetratricopeptide (TPR) repeat protein
MFPHESHESSRIKMWNESNLITTLYWKGDNRGASYRTLSGGTHLCGGGRPIHIERRRFPLWVAGKEHAMRRVSKVGCLLIVAALSAFGCSSSSNKLAAQHHPGDGILDGITDFDKQKEPAFSADTRFAAGQLAESQNATDRAIDQYNEAIKIDPNHEQALYRLGVLYTQTHQFDKAIETWKRYVDATKGSPTAYSNLALCFEVAGRLPEAESAFKVGIANAPNSEVTRINYGLMLARQSRREEAIAQLQAVLKPAAVYYNLAAVSEQQGKIEAAQKDYARSLQLDPTSADARIRLARLDKAAAMAR